MLPPTGLDADRHVTDTGRLSDREDRHLGAISGNLQQLQSAGDQDHQSAHDRQEKERASLHEAEPTVTGSRVTSWDSANA